MEAETVLMFHLRDNHPTNINGCITAAESRLGSSDPLVVVAQLRRPLEGTLGNAQ